MPVGDRAPSQRAVSRGELASKMRELILRQMYDVAIQAAIGRTHHRPRERRPMRKDVFAAKCYGGDISARRSCSKSRRRARNA